MINTNGDLQSIIQEIKILIEPIVIKKEAQNINFPVEFTFFHVLERAYVNMISLRLLVGDSLINHDHAIGLICRNLLTDFITTGHIIRNVNSNEESYQNLYSLHYSDIKKIDSLIKMYKKYKVINEIEFSKIKEKIDNESNIYKIVKDYAIEYKLKTFPGTREIIEKFLSTNLSDIWVQEIKNSYDTWLFYSKYEHLGWFSYELTRDIGSAAIKKRIMMVLRCTTIMIGSCLEILNEKEMMKRSIVIYEKLYNS
ncbi:MAG: hypothetical protein H7Y00_09205 [Fimbriimonadaceae bacterium]|nr:hypothetical protein [Chitinophagales bacterium]